MTIRALPALGINGKNQLHGLVAHPLSQPGIPNKKQEIVSGLRLIFILILARAAIVKLVFRRYRDPKSVYHIVRRLGQLRRQLFGAGHIRKVCKVDGKYYWDLYAPGFKSQAFTKFIEGEANRIVPVRGKSNRFTNVFVAFTKKCSLQCEHCFEWNILNKKEMLSIDQIKDIISKFQERGTAQIQLTGGEPLLRVNDIVDILNSSTFDTEFWVLSSGYNLTYDNAIKLKRAGLTGIVISLDDYDPTRHDEFRGIKNSYAWALAAVTNAISANLVTALSICVTRSFVSETNLMAYSELARSLGVSFVQILEPSAVGHYEGMDVLLTAGHQDTLEKFYLKMNREQRYAQFPIVTYHGYHLRRAGCFGSGNRNLYVDTDGDIRACPFCQTKAGHALSGDLDTSIERLQSIGCHSFNPAST